jgi:hypothetical protein
MRIESDFFGEKAKCLDGEQEAPPVGILLQFLSPFYFFGAIDDL